VRMSGRWLVTGGGGLLGQDMARVLRDDPTVEVTAPGHAELDITGSQVAAMAGEYDVVVNTAAWTSMDEAECYPDEALRVNGSAPGALAQACERAGTVLLHVSSNAVFSGSSEEPYQETDIPDPVSVYGWSKYLGETSVRAWAPRRGVVVRTAGLYGAGGDCFVSKLLTSVRDKGAGAVTVVYDQWVQPTWSYALAQHLRDLGHGALMGQVTGGVYHGVTSGQVTWYGLAVEAVALMGLDQYRLVPVPSERRPRPASRGRYMVLNPTRWDGTGSGVRTMGGWRDMLETALRTGMFGQVPA
jgi:dTDP-4-dehydrorhamnose reductase